jgi:ABC-type protease/lipase transport system fused ATPase/permease subunit
MARDNLVLRAGLWLDHELGQHLLQNGLRVARSPDDLHQDARALDQFKSLLTSSAITPLFDAPWVPIFLLALTALHPIIGAIAAASCVLLFVAALLQNFLTSRLQNESGKAHERAESWWMKIAGNGLQAGALGLTDGASKQWEEFNRAHIAAAYSQGKRSSFVKAIARSVRIGSQIALYGIGAWLVIENQIAPGALVASAILLSRALAPLEHLVGSVKAARSAWTAYGRLKQLPLDAEMPAVSDRPAEAAAHITITDASFYYPGRRAPSLRGVTLSIEPGSCTAIVGPNGSGKTTLAAMIAGAIAPTTGSASLDGVPVTKWQRAGGPSLIGYLPDDAMLIDGSVHDNIAKFSNASLMSVAKAAMRAGVHEVLHGLHAGYDTPVGPNGSLLALRERRAVAFARALFGEPKLVVLDEPELGLDGAGLKQLHRVLGELKAAGIGLIVTTQDPKLLKLVDRIVVMNAGMIQSQGPASQFTPQRPEARASGAAEMH